MCSQFASGDGLPDVYATPGRRESLLWHVSPEKHCGTRQNIPPHTHEMLFLPHVIRNPCSGLKAQPGLCKPTVWAPFLHTRLYLSVILGVNHILQTWRYANFFFLAKRKKKKKEIKSFSVIEIHDKLQTGFFPPFFLF